MRYRPLGRTGLQISEIGFGCGSTGGLMVRGAEAAQVRAVARALEAGINYFDTAPSYGDGRSETNLGRVLRELGADPLVGTKVRVAPEEVAEAPAAIRRSIDASLAGLGRDYVDLLQLHSRIANEGSGYRGSLRAEDVLGSVLEGLRAARTAGLTRFIGFTGLGETQALRRVVLSGAFDTVQAYFNALNPSAGHPVAPSFTGQDFGRLIDDAAGAMGVIAIRVLAAGAMSGVGVRHPVAGSLGSVLVPGAEYDADLDRAQRLEAVGRELGTESPVELGLRFALSKAGVSTVLVGFSDVEQLEAALRWAAAGPLAEASMARVLACLG